jgi:hypothetical protein
MRPSAKTTQLQIRVTPAEKAALARAARRAGLAMSAYVLGKALPGLAAEWESRVRELARSRGDRLALAGLSAWLAGLAASELAAAVATPPPALPEFHANYVAAMVEQLCAAAAIDAPAWTREIAPLAQPAFGSELASLRLHLLASSPPPYRRRNLFIDTAAGGQV